MNWKKEYESKRTSPAEAVQCVRSGDRVYVGSGCAVPQGLTGALVERGDELRDVEIVHLLTFGMATYSKRQHAKSFHHNAFFIGGNVRDAVNEGRADYTPIFLSEIPALFQSGQMPLDCALVMVSPPDANGFCSLGIHPDLAMSAVKTAKTVIAEVNRSMPRVHGDTFVHVRDIDMFVENTHQLVELVSEVAGPISSAIGRHIASLVPDGATLQLGIGKIPDAILPLLINHQDLGIHSEMIGNGVIDLMERGVITNARKPIHAGKVVASFAMGTFDLYEYLRDNPAFEFHPTEYVNDPRIIAQHPKMVSVNSAVEVDLTGQVVSDSMGHRFYSGIGGQVDFIRGAAMSDGGRPVLALPSTAAGGTRSRIVTELTPGAGVVTSRGDVHYVVTEYGVAYLHGKSVRERAMALVEIAHPDFRPELRAHAVNRKLIPSHWQVPSELDRYPEGLE
ncbi:MAG: acetyl-CoA hydrolase/transferase family protein, partial [Gemmatimonadetes bacterium]|nr:acetyl-CoA hydrolase/transferase family protein [Gemmatimonadota bacterium]